MKRIKLTKILILVFILSTLLIPTTPALADTEYILIDPCEGFEPLGDAQIYCGVHKGAGYRIEVPDNWNGDLLMWAHGDRFDPTYLYIENPPFREWLVENGYAWAASSYSANFLDHTVGIMDTKALALWFHSKIAKPEHTYIAGNAMGGAIAVVSVEQWPNLYDAAMPVCGSLAQYEENDVLWDYYVLSTALTDFETTYPFPEDFVSSGDYAAVIDGLAGVPGGYPYLLNEQGHKFKNAMEMLTGGERPLFDQGFIWTYGIMDLILGIPVLEFLNHIHWPGVNGVYVDNWDTIYQLDLDPTLSLEEEALNELIFRIQRDPQARHPNGLKNVPVTNGNIKVPVLSMHAIGELMIPFSEEQIYARRVAAQGGSDLLVQRAIREILYCDFTQEEYISAFTDLVNWTENGVKPTGDDILDPASVADPNFGCQFTSEDRDYSWVEGMLGITIEIPACP
jgi:hypothetical protein